MRHLTFLNFSTVSIAAFALMVGTESPANAVPSFARQTGLACESCHTVFPELTPFGRRFKLSGYTLTTKPGINDMTDDRESRLSLVDIPPLSIMLQASTSWVNKATADTTGNSAKAQNGTTEFPQQLGLFYAGRIADTMGAFLQVTYSQNSGTIGIDNSDVRFADRLGSTDLLYGITLNNNPTIQDVWNSTPGWGFPWISPSGAPTPSASPLVVNTMAQKVAGLGAYAMYKDSFYVEATAYRSAISGSSAPYDSSTLYNSSTSTAGTSVIQDLAPYWRAAYERQWGNNSLEVGTFGMWAKVLPTFSGASVSPGAANTYLDTAFDAQYQYIGIRHIFSLSGSYVHELESNNSAWVGSNFSNTNDTLNRFLATGTWYYRRKYGLSASFEKLTGTADPLLYPTVSTAGTGGGSANGKPDSQFEVIEADYLPWLNTKLLLQYTIYNQINGGSQGYDGVSGRKASDNNTLMFALWTAF